MQSKGNNLVIFYGFEPHSGIELKVNQAELVEDPFLYSWMNLVLKRGRLEDLLCF